MEIAGIVEEAGTVPRYGATYPFRELDVTRNYDIVVRQESLFSLL